MFGRRTTIDLTTPTRAISAAKDRRDAGQGDRGQAGAGRGATARPAKQEPATPERRHSEEYYDVKTTVFNALIDTIDLDPARQAGGGGGARGDPRHRQRDHPDQERRDVDRRAGGAARGHLQRRAGLRPARAAAGPRRHRRHHGQRRQHHLHRGRPARCRRPAMRFADNAQLMNICQRIVSQVGRRVDESSPICDARLPDGSRVNVIAPPLAIDGPALTIRKFKKDRLKLEQLVQIQVDLAGGQDPARDHRPGALQHPDLRRHGLGQDHAAQLPHRLDRSRRAHHHLRGLRRAAAAAAARRAAGDAPAQPRGRGRDHHARPGQELPAHAARADHRRRGARTGGVRPAAGHEHRPRRLDGHAARQLARARPSAVWRR